MLPNVVIEIEHFTVRLVGSSYDLRTNRWRATCRKCKKEYEPQTTMLRWQTLECPKCGKIDIINYNAHDEPTST